MHICQTFRNDKRLLKYLTDRKLKMSALLSFEIKGAKKDNIFDFLNGCFSIVGDPIDMIFGVFSKIYARLLKSIISQFFSKYRNVKSCLKLNGRLKKGKLCWGHQITWT